MESGFSFFRSKLARRFIFLFICCAFVPTCALIIISYQQVVSQLEEQSNIRLRREIKAYSQSLYDRMLRINHELKGVGRFLTPYQTDFSIVNDQYNDVFKELFKGVTLYTYEENNRSIYGNIDAVFIKNQLTDEILKNDKPFILNHKKENEIARFFFGVNIRQTSLPMYTLIAEVKLEYLWGIGPAPLLPPMTELLVYDKTGKNMLAGVNGPWGTYGDLKRYVTQQSPNILQYEHNNKIYHAGISNLFMDSAFQPTGWVIILSRARQDIMSAIDDFKKTFPVIILFFLSLIIYLSFLFIRRGLEPLEELKRGTSRIAKRNFSIGVNIKSGDEFEDLGKSFNDMAGKLDKQFDTLNVLSEIDRAILSSLDPQKTVATTLHRLRKFYNCDSTFFIKQSDNNNSIAKIYTMQKSRLEDTAISYCSITPEDENLLFIEANHIFTNSRELDSDLLINLAEQKELHFLCLPLSIDGNIKRALLLGHTLKHQYDEDELAHAKKIADQLAIALANSILIKTLENLAKGTIEALARTVDAKSKWTSGHSERVSKISGKIAQVMGFSEPEIEILTRAGMLHDIGKIGVPIAILDKPSELNDREYDKIKDHPAIGAKILEPIMAYQDILPIVLQHHERFDGTGYPKGIAGSDIDIRARIMAVADVWDAVVSDRPYRGGWVTRNAKRLIIEGSGKHFDPKVVNAFLTVTEAELL